MKEMLELVQNHLREDNEQVLKHEMENIFTQSPKILIFYDNGSMIP